MKKNSGFTLVELICVLIILALLTTVAGKKVVGSINTSKMDIDSSKEKSILNAAEKWAIANAFKFDDVEGSSISIGLDVIFVVDVSSSMSNCMTSESRCSKGNKRYEATVTAINSSLEVLKSGLGNRVGFVFYSGLAGSVGRCRNEAGIASAECSIVATVPLTAISDINSLSYGDSKIVLNRNGVKSVNVSILGGTYTSLGIRQAVQLFESSKNEDRLPVIVLLTDGDATWGADVSNSFQLSNSVYGKGTDISPVRYESTGKQAFMETVTREDGHTVVTYVNPKNQTYSLEYWKEGNCTQTIEISGHNKGKETRYNCSSRSFSFSKSTSSYNTVRYSNIDAYIEGVIDQYKKWYSENYPNSELISMIFDLTRTSYLAKNKLASDYGNPSYFYTIGLGVTTSQGTFMLNPSEDNLNKLSWYDDIYSYFKSRNDYYYPTKSFIGNMSPEELRKIFVDIATEVTEATKVTQICLTVEDLKKEGYLSKDANISDSLAKNNYVIISENETTNQYAFSLAKTDEQKKMCRDLIDKSN